MNMTQSQIHEALRIARKQNEPCQVYMARNARWIAELEAMLAAA
jgi:hypothetical protein